MIRLAYLAQWSQTSYVSELPGRLNKHSFLGSTPRVSDSIGLIGAQQCPFPDDTDAVGRDHIQIATSLDKHDVPVGQKLRLVLKGDRWFPSRCCY